MRLDLFLKISRLVKRRAVAQELCESGDVLLNGHAAKAAKDVRTGDRITLRLPSRILEIEVVDIPASSKRPATLSPVRILSEARRPWDENR